jgi:hypothetical protein
MRYSPKFGIQAGGNMRRWSNPERSFHFSLVKVDFDCEPDAYPGVLILTDPSHKGATLLEVKDPRKELLKILAPRPDNTIAYWQIVREDEERRKVIAGLTANPIFDDILG